MVLFFVGLAFLILGGVFYSKVVEGQFQPDDRGNSSFKKSRWCRLCKNE